MLYIIYSYFLKNIIYCNRNSIRFWLNIGIIEISIILLNTFIFIKNEKIVNTYSEDEVDIQSTKSTYCEF